MRHSCPKSCRAGGIPVSITGKKALEFGRESLILTAILNGNTNMITKAVYRQAFSLPLYVDINQTDEK